mgnify:CR=1 FL=1
MHTLDDQEAVNKACKGVRAVICFIGPRKTDKVSPLPHAVEAIAQGMRTTGVKRLLVQMGGFTQLKGESNGMGSKLAKGAFGYTLHPNQKIFSAPTLPHRRLLHDTYIPPPSFL